MESWLKRNRRRIATGVLIATPLILGTPSCVHKTKQSHSVQQLAKAQRDKDANVKWHATKTLVYQYLNKKNRKGIMNLLSHEDVEIRKNTASTLAYAAWNRQDITSILPALAKALGDENTTVRWYTAATLAYAAKNGRDITPALRGLTKVLEDKDANVRVYAAVALTHYYLNTNNQEELNKLLNHKNADVRKGATQAQEDRMKKMKIK